MFTRLLQSIFIMEKVGNLLKKLTDPTVIIIRVGFMALCNAWVGNLHKDQGVILDFFIMAEAGNLDTCLGGYFSLYLTLREMSDYKTTRLLECCALDRIWSSTQRLEDLD